MPMAKMAQNGPLKKLKKFIFISQQELHSKLQELSCSVRLQGDIPWSGQSSLQHEEDGEQWTSHELRLVMKIFFFFNQPSTLKNEA